MAMMVSICTVVESIRVSGRSDSAASAVAGSRLLTAFQDFHFIVSNNLPMKKGEKSAYTVRKVSMFLSWKDDIIV